MPFYSIVIVTRNRHEQLTQAITSIENQNYHKEKFELIIVDNASTDCTKKRVNEISKNMKLKIHYIFEKNVGISFARNAGLTKARGDWIIYFDDDTIVDHSFLHNLDCALKANPTAKAFGGKALIKRPDKLPFFWSSHFEGYLSSVDYGINTVTIHFPQTPYGLNMGFERKILQMLNGFNEEIIFGGDETELFYRLEQNNINTLYIPNCLVHHVVSENRFTIFWLLVAAYRSGHHHAKLANLINNQKIVKGIIFGGLKKIITKKGQSPLLVLLYITRIIGYFKYNLKSHDSHNQH